MVGMARILMLTVEKAPRVYISSLNLQTLEYILKHK